MSNPSAAIIATDDIMVATVMQMLQCAGLCVSGDRSVIGLADRDNFRMYLNPTHTLVQLPVVVTGDLAIHNLLGNMTGN